MPSSAWQRKAPGPRTLNYAHTPAFGKLLEGRSIDWFEVHLASAENPLLPHARLRELHALMQRCRTLDRKQATVPFAREGLLAATALQLEPGDLLLPESEDQVQSALQPQALDKAQPRIPGAFAAGFRLPLCAGVAYGLQAAGAKRFALCYMRSGQIEPGWAATLIWAQEQRVPLLLACADVRGPGRRRQGEVLSWEALSATAQRCGLPVFPVDAEDAVAVYRVMYEAILRTRDGGGPAVIWGLFNNRSRTTTPRSMQPLARLEAYLRSRGIRRRT